MKQTCNITKLRIWIAENGDQEAREAIYKAGPISQGSLSRVLKKGQIPRWEVRYRIYKLTGIKLCEDDEFPERQEAS